MLKVKRGMRASKNQTRLTSVIGGRKGVTVCTSSWANGDRGPLFISIAPGALSGKSAHVLRKGKGEYLIWKNDSGSHFMTSETTVRMYCDLLTDCYDMRRSLYDLHNRKGLLVADAFTGNFTKSSGNLVDIQWKSFTENGGHLSLMFCAAFLSWLAPSMV